MSIFSSRKKAAVAHEAAAPSLEGVSNESRLVKVPVDSILPNPDQPRRSFNAEKINELAASIEQVGLIQPLVVCKRGGVYELIAGERRLRAVKQLGWRYVSCVIERDVSEENSALMAIVENLQRENLHFFEEADCYASTISNLGITQEELALRLGKSQSFIANKLRLLRLSPDVAAEIVKNGLSERHARALLRLKDDGLQLTAVAAIVRDGLSVKATDKLIEKMLIKNADEKRKNAPQKPRIIRLFRDYRVFLNTVGSACEQLRECGLRVDVEQKELDNGVDISIRVTQL